MLLFTITNYSNESNVAAVAAKLLLEWFVWTATNLLRYGVKIVSQLKIFHMLDIQRCIYSDQPLSCVTGFLTTI